MSRENSRRAEIGRAVVAWRTALQPEPTGTDRQRSQAGAKRASLARLRRAPSTMAALLQPEVIDLVRHLIPLGVAAPRAATIARVLAQFRTPPKADGGRRLPLIRMLGPQGKDETAKLKPLRLERLLDTTDEEELARQMIRLVQLVERDATIDLADLGVSLAWWHHDSIRIVWAYAYYDTDAPAASTAAPDDQPISEARS